MRLPLDPRVVGSTGDIDARRLTELLRQVASQVNGVSEGQVTSTTNAQTAAPTTGTAKQGDFIKNSAPSGATPTIGWVCTASGTPGTWIAVSVGGGGGSTQGKHEIPIMASAMRPTISNGAAYPNTIENTINAQDLTTIDFDGTTAENIQFPFYLPKKWDLGTLKARFLWSHAATTVNFGVVWYAQFVGFRDGDLMNTTTWGAAQQIADTGGTTNNCYITSETPAVTAGGTLVAGGNQMYCRVGRLPADASDTMAIDARLHGIIISCTTNADTDA